MSTEYLEHIMQWADVPGIAALVLADLAAHADDDGIVCRSAGAIAQRWQIGEKTVRSSLKLLTRERHLVPLGRIGPRRTACYRIELWYPPDLTSTRPPAPRPTRKRKPSRRTGHDDLFAPEPQPLQEIQEIHA